MTKRNPVSALKNIWHDAEQVDNDDLTLEQEFNDAIESSTIANHIGYGVIPEVLVQHTLFDSALSIGFLDGIAIATQNQPSDNNFGNQLEITLSHSRVGFRKTVKVCVIGLDFQSNLQYETFVFRANEIQVSHKHFTKILVLLFNDFIGDSNLSLNLEGHLVIKEAQPMTLSRSAIMVAQSVQPNLFFRDFFVDGFPSLQALLQNALPLYNIDALNIKTNELDQQVLLSGDVSTQIGEKFLATTNNIQKITLLLSVRNQILGQENNLVWNGDLVCSIYPLQATIDCPTDIAPNLAIDFAPANVPVAQISFNYTSLQDDGVILDSIPQPIDFIFSNSPAAGGNVIVPNAYYAVTLKRSGSANQCDILLATGTSTTPNSRITVFTGSLWVDIPEQQLWFETWTDAAKVSDGQAYENGHGVVIPKTNIDPDTNATIDNSLENLQFTGNDVFRAVLSAVVQESVEVPDQRTGEPVLTRQEFVPQINLLNTIDITNLEVASEPLLLGAIADKNIKFFNALSNAIHSKLYSATMVNDELLIKIITDPTDTVRYDTSVIALQSELLNGMFVGAKIFPNGNNPNVFYRIADARLCSYLVGDVNGDGIIDSKDLDLLNSYINFNLNLGLPLNTEFFSDGYTTTFTNGYTTLITPFTSQLSLEFQLVKKSDGTVVADGYDGILVADPNDPRLAQFTSSSVTFNTIVGISDYNLMIISPTIISDYGGFEIISLDSTNDVLTIRKILLNGETIGQMFRADIDNDLIITANDGYLLDSYIDRQVAVVPSTPPAFTNPYTNIGTPFNIVRFRVEKFIDRTDDYSSVSVGRSTQIHVAPDIFEGDGYFAKHDFYHSPINLTINQELSWDESLIVVNSHPKQVPSVFTTLNGFTDNDCQLHGITCNIYGSNPAFDAGRVDFYVPNNLIIGTGGEIQNPDGSFFKVDFEMGTITLEIPNGSANGEKTINLLDDFVADYTGTGITRLGFPAMRFADCSLVDHNAITNDQLRFSVSVQSFSPNTGNTVDGYSGVLIDSAIGTSIDYQTGLLTLSFAGMFDDITLKSQSTKVQIDVFLKKSGFNNQPLFVDSAKIANMLKLISIFPGANSGSSAVVDLSSSNDVTGILPVIHGGTGIGILGASGTVLTSNGTGLVYSFITNSNVDAAAAIDGSKINPNFGSQTLIAGPSNIGPIINKLVTSSGRRLNTLTITANYNILITDEVIMVGAIGSPITINLPTFTVDGDFYSVKDHNGSAAINNITISGNGNNIDGSSSPIVLNKNYQSVRLIFAGSQWNLI